MNPAKIGFTALALAVSFQFSNAAANSCNIVPDGLVACYPFDGDAKDYSGNGNDGTPFGNVLYVDGKVGRAAQFDGTGSYVSLGTNSSLKMENAVTLATWVKPLLLPDRAANVISDHSMSFNNGKILRLQESRVEFLLGPEGDLEVGYPWNDTDAWKYVVATFDGNYMQFYINGQLVDSVTNSHSIAVNPNPVLIGKSGFDEYFNGLLDDLRIYNRALTEAEIKQLYSASSTTNTGECSNPATYDAETGLVSLPAIDIPLLSPISGEPTGEIAVFSGKLKQVKGVEDFEILGNNLSFIKTIPQYDETHARYEYNDGIFSNGGKLKACVSVPSIAIIPPNTRIITDSKNYKVSLRQLAVSPNIFHLESAALVTP